ncbi:hypothetical protein L6452_13682 [Arctium lappa]|uniref:Uncharacterized protein n=1 Tax=Arctium lappa TaxID=4217 RepID=A0ACB9CIY9_ARCLA|nr:hypothetical protein L6452_13682 [Arctium lappa]
MEIERETVDTQLIAHDKEVSVDGSARVFDLRDKEHSTIIYKSSEPDTPLLCLDGTSRTLNTWTSSIDSAKVIVDIRHPTGGGSAREPGQRQCHCFGSTQFMPHLYRLKRVMRWRLVDIDRKKKAGRMELCTYNRSMEEELEPPLSMMEIENKKSRDEDDDVSTDEKEHIYGEDKFWEEGSVFFYKDEYDEYKKMGRLDECGHGYHSECIKTWLLRKNVCPMCKASAFTI